MIRGNHKPTYECMYADVFGGEYLTTTTEMTVHIEGLNEAGQFTLGTQDG